MERIILYIFGFIIVMTVILWPMKAEKIKAIGGFFSVVLPRIPFVGMIKAYLETKNVKSKRK